MHGNNPTRDSIERALDVAEERGQIQAWRRLPGYGPHAKWLVRLNPGAVAGTASDAELRTYQEAKLFCGALASAGQVTALPAQVKVTLQAGLRSAIDKMESDPNDGEHWALYGLATVVAELLDVSFDSYVSTTDREDDEDEARP